MSHRASPLRPLTAVRAKGLSGRLRAPGDTVISHLALILGASARGETIIEGLAENEETAATRRALQALGVLIEKRDATWSVTGLGAGGLLAPLGPLDFGHAQSGLAYCMGLVGPYGFATRFTGEAALPWQRMERAFDALRAAGVEILEQRAAGLPITLRGPRTPVPVELQLPPGAGEIKTLLLLAGIAVPGTTLISEAGASSDVAETMLGDFGASIVTRIAADGGRQIEMAGLPDLAGQNILVPGDPQAVAPLLVAGLVVPGSDITIENVLIDPARSGLIDILRQMGGSIEAIDTRPCSRWNVADLRVRHSALKGVTAFPETMTGGIADDMALAIAAAFAEGQTELPISEAASPGSRRLEAMARELMANGVVCSFTRDALAIGGVKKIGGGTISTGGDPLLAMNFLAMGLAASGGVTIDDQSAIDPGYPDFVASLERLGAKFFKRVPQ